MNDKYPRCLRRAAANHAQGRCARAYQRRSWKESDSEAAGHRCKNSAFERRPHWASAGVGTSWRGREIAARRLNSAAVSGDRRRKRKMVARWRSTRTPGFDGFRLPALFFRARRSPSTAPTSFLPAQKQLLAFCDFAITLCRKPKIPTDQLVKICCPSHFRLGTILGDQLH